MVQRTSPQGEEAAEVERQTLAQWGQSPAGFHASAGTELGQPESFAAIEADRAREQPWMQETFDFEQFRGMRVLEIGVGLGTDHAWLARAGAELSGIDLTPRCISLTEQRFALEGLKSDLRVMDAQNLEFDDDTFDAVYSFGVLHHAFDPSRAFAEVRRVLRPGGVFVGALYNKRSAFYLRLLARMRDPAVRAQSRRERLSAIERSTGDAVPLVKLYTARELRNDLQAAGFPSVRLEKRHLGLGRYTERVPPIIERLGGRLGGWYLVHWAK